MNEEPAGLISIGEFARRSGLSISALRFYGDSALLAACWIDPGTGYRYYSAEQLAQAALIRQLRVLEMPIADIRALLTADAAAARDVLDRHWRGLELRLDRGRSALAVAHELLSSKEEAMSATITLNGAELARGLRQVMPAAGPCGHETRYPASVLVEIRPDGLRLVATDGHRLAMRDLPASTTKTDRTVISLHDAEQLATFSQRAGSVCLGAGGELEATAGGQTLDIPAASRDYPDYEALLDRVGSARLIVRVDELLRRLDPSKGLVVLHLGGTAPKADGESFAGEYEGDELTIGLNPAFLADALSAGVGPDVILQLGSPVEPVAMRWMDQGTLTCLVMPIRLIDPAGA